MAGYERVIVGSVAIGLAAGMSVAAPSFSAADAEEARTVAAKTDYRGVVETLRREIPAMMAEAGVVGATVALVDGDRVIMARGFGWADRRRRRPVTSRTLFHIGSVSKTFAALSVMQLVEKGKVKLDAPITRYVPELKLLPLVPSGVVGVPPARRQPGEGGRFKRNRITVRSVLDHHSGIPGDIFYRMITMKRPDPQFQQWLLKTLRRMPPERRVNTGWAYNNSGYVLLKPLVENVTGQEYAYRTARTLFKRMGMRTSSFDDTLAPARAMTRNYVPVIGPDGRPTGRMVAGPREYVNGWTAGSILSSAQDMAKYLQTLIRGGRGTNGRVVKASTLRRMTTRQINLPLDHPTRNGLSFFGYQGWYGRMFGHDGATTRNFSNLLVHPGQDLGVFVSTNTVGGLALTGQLAPHAMALMYTAKTGIPPPAPAVLPDPGPRTPTQDELAAAAGRYAGYTDFSDVAVDGDHLVLTTHGPAGPGAPASFTAMAGGWWKTDADPNLQIAFRRMQGKSVLLYRNGGHSRIVPAILGMKARPINIPKRWRRAAGEYRVRLRPMYATDLVPTTVTLSIGDRSCELDLGEPGQQSRQALLPIEGNTAYTFGWSGSGGRRKGDVVRLKGDRLTFMGVTYRKVE